MLLLQALIFNHCDNLQLSGLTHVNSPAAQLTVMGSNNVTISNLHVIAPEDSTNTDGIMISNSHNVNILDSFIGTGNLNFCFPSNINCHYFHDAIN